MASLTARQTFANDAQVGGHDAAAAVGLDEYKTPLQLWGEKTGRLQRERAEDKDAVVFGRLLEGVIADEFARRRELRVQRDHRTFVHPVHSFMVGHIDRRIVGLRQGLEVKTASLRVAKQWGDAGTDAVPTAYMVQCQHYMAITGFNAWHVAVLIAGNDFRSYVIQRDDELIANLIERELQFFECLKSDTPPDPVTLEDASRRWPLDKGGHIYATDEILTEYAGLTHLRDVIAKLERQADEHELRIKQYMQEHETLLADATHKLCTWSSQEARRVDVKKLRGEYPDIAKACEVVGASRVFRLK